MKRAVFGLVLLGVLTVGLAAGPSLWAAPGQDPARQTVPTRTPQPLPTNPPSKSPGEQPTSTPATTATVVANVPAAESSGPSLPQAGGRSLRLPLFGALVALGLAMLMAVGRFE
jgi:hypothetical protein